MENYEELLKDLSPEEYAAAIKILDEVQSTGTSESLKDLYLKDYDELPVDIDTFLRDPNYLGKGLIDEEGKFTVFPYWNKLLRKLYPDPMAPATCNTLALTGSIGIGKSFVGVIVGLYELYRMLCLKDPYLYYGLQPIDKITFALINITLDAAKSVAWDKMQQLLQVSPWFLAHGTVTGTTNLNWQPNKNIELITGSIPRHILGRALFWCLDGDTIISTTQGDFPIKDLVGKPIQVYSMSNDGSIVVSDYCTVKPTAQEIIEYEIELEDGSIIKCTPNHRFMLIDGSYKEAQDLTEDDEIMDFNQYGYIYLTRNLINNKIYIGQHKWEKSILDESYYGSGTILNKAIEKYGLENFEVTYICSADSKEKLDELEKYYIDKYNSTNDEIGYNICLGGMGGPSGPKSEETRKKMSESAKRNNNYLHYGSHQGKVTITDGHTTKYVDKSFELPEGWEYGNCKVRGKRNMDWYYTNEQFKAKRKELSSGSNNGMYGKGYLLKGEKNGMYGKHHSEETKRKISDAKKGKTYSAEINKKKGRPGQKKPEGFGDKLRQVNLGKRWYNNGEIQRLYRPEEAPEGWERGILK